MENLKGGYSLVEFDDDVNFTDAKEITQLFKAGTGLTPKSPTEEFADGTLRCPCKQMEISVRSANVDNAAGSAYALLKAAEEARTKLNFRYIGISGGVLIENCEDAWETNVHADVTSSADSGDKKVGTASAKFVLGDTIAAFQVLAEEEIAATDLTGCKGISLWIKSTEALSAGDLILRLSDGVSFSEAFSIPALTAATWTKVYLASVNPALLTAIALVGLETGVIMAVNTIRLDDIRGVAKNVVIKDVVVKVEFEETETGKFNAMKVIGEAIADSEDNLLVRNY